MILRVLASTLLACAALCVAVLVARMLEGRTDRARARRRAGLSVRRSVDDGQPNAIAWGVVAAIAIGSSLVGALSLGAGGLLAGAIPVAGHTMRVRKGRESRSELIAEELAPALQLIVGQLRIGRNVVSAIAEVSDTVQDPLGGILKDVVSEVRLGTPIDEVMHAWADREHNRHLGVVASAIGLHARHGGSLVEILETVIDTIEEEDRLRRDIKSVTADGRLSATVLMGMPPVMLLLVSILSPGYASPLVNDPIGRAMGCVGLILGAVGWKWLRNLSSPRVVA